MRFLSQVYTIARGSVGGITYTANQFHGLIARARTSPVQPNTSAQTMIKSAFSFASQQWESLTDAARSLWDAYAATCLFSGPLGTYTIPGRQIFTGGLSLINYINASGLDIITVDTNPPLLAGRLTLGNVVAGTFITPSETGIAVNFDLPGTFDYVVLGQHSIAFNPSRQRYKGPWLTGSGQVIDNTGPVAATMSWNGLVEDQIYFVRIRAVLENEPARYSEDYIVRCVAVANGP